MLVAYSIYFVIIAVYLTVSGIAAYHVHRFRTEWDITKKVTIVYAIFSITLILISFILMRRVPWDNLF